MPATTRMPIRSTKLENILKGAFALYAILSLGSMATMSVGALVLIFALVFTSKSFDALKIEIKNEWKRPASRIYFWLSTFLTLVCFLSLIGGILFPLHYGSRNPAIHLASDMAKAWYLFWPLILVIGLRRLKESDQYFVIQSWVITFGILSLIGIAQYYTGWPRPQAIPGENLRYHATLFLGHHLSVASILIFPFFVTLDLLKNLAQNFSKNSKKALLFGFIALLGCITLFLTYSRTLWIALPIGVLIWCFLALPKRTWVPLAVGTTLLSIAALQFPPIQRRIHSGMGLNTRQELWLANFEFLRQRPLTGVGWRHNQELSGYYLIEKYHNPDVFSGHAHNNLIDMLGGTGILGALAWLAWCGWIFWILFQKRNQTGQLNFRNALICAWIVFQINGLTQVNFWEAKVQHQMAWVIAWALL